ncbi:MAG: aminoacyl-tRNA hydrolase, partial [Patescibacteria group bacterium]
MKLIVGLGNPGKQYENTRHNVGYMVIDKIKNQKLKIKNMMLVKTNVFMNNSGEAIKKLTTDYRLQTTDLYVVHDDLDIPLGQFKIQYGRGPKDHKGIQSIEETLGTNEFWRVRVGVDNRDPSDR